MIRVKLDELAFMPEKAHEADAGYDLRTPYGFAVKGTVAMRNWFDGYDVQIGQEIIDTGIHVQIPEGYVGMIKTKSGINTKRSILTEGVIDAGYTGSIKVKLYNLGTKNQEFKRGDKITQLVIIPIHKCNEMTQVDSLEETERGNDGFGSSGR